MIDASTIPAEKISFTTRMIRDLALERGWKVSMYYVGSSHVRLQRPDGKVLEIFSATPPTTSFVAAHRADDKFLTHIALQEASLPVSETYLVHTIQEANENASKIFSQGLKCVVKPLDEGHGNGITVGVTEHTLEAAFAYAKGFSERIIIQSHVEQPIDIRVACIDYKYVAALVRIPARVMGDGVHTIEQLIEMENSKDYRGENYVKTLNRISKERAGVYLGDELSAIPSKGMWVQVLGTANVGTGGETVDVTDDMPTWLIEQAEKAARATQLPSVGVDFFVSAMTQKNMTTEDLHPVIVEVNKCPALFLHETPTHGKPRPVIAAYLDYLADI